MAQNRSHFPLWRNPHITQTCLTETENTLKTINITVEIRFKNCLVWSRYCTEATFFEVKEVDLGLVADLGTLQRLPRIVGFGNAMELAMTGRRFGGTEAKSLGLVSRVFASKQEMEEGVSAIAQGTLVVHHTIFNIN